MESYCNIPAMGLLILALSVACSSKPQCQGKTDVTCLAGSYYNNAVCKCEECPENTYSSQTGVKTLSCTRCKQCVGIFQYRVKCSPKQNADCECIAGYRCTDDICSMCDRICKPGEEATAQGCRKCPHKTFNDQTNGSCKPWRNCRNLGLGVLVNGNTTTDTVCTHPLYNSSVHMTAITVHVPVLEGAVNPEEKAPAYDVVIAASVFCFVCMACSTVAIVAWVKKKVKKGFTQIPAEIVKPAQEEDACSCRFPEEEQGDTVTQEP